MKNSTETTKQLKPHELRKEVKRLTQSRDNIKTKSRVKAQAIKDYQDRLREVTEGRNRWKAEVKEEKKINKLLQDKLNRRDEMLSQAQAELNQLVSEIRDIKKKSHKFSRSTKSSG